MIASFLHARSFLNRLRRPALVAALATAVVSQASAYTQVWVFGDSLSDVGNFAYKTQTAYGVSYPGSQFNYSDHRFTNSSDTKPSGRTYTGVWHEQLERRFLNMTPVTNSRNGGTDYAFGDAETLDGTRDVTIQSTPAGDLTVTIDNMGKQVSDYLSKFTADPQALYIVWGGANDMFADHSDANVTATAARMGGLVTKLAQAGARTFIVPNLPPLGDTPNYNTNANDMTQLNNASASYRTQLNSALDTAVAQLGSQGITITVVRIDVYSLFQGLIANPSLYGFTNVTNSVQGLSTNPDQYLFWDNVHPTTAGHNQIALAAAQLLPGGHPSFFNGENTLTGNFDYLAFPSGVKFGYYSYQYFPFLYSTDLGYEYFIASTGSDSGAYLYDFSLGTFLFTSPSLYPYLYNFNTSSFYYYFTGTTNPRSFYDFGTGKFVQSN